MLKLGPEAYFNNVEDLAGSFWMTTSVGVGVLCLIAESVKWVLTEPGAM